MKWILTALGVLLLLPPCLRAQTPNAAMQREMSRIDALCADPDLKLVVVAAMADSIQEHRNHLLLLHKDTGQSFAKLFVSELRARGIDDEGILRSLSTLLREVNRQLARYNVVTPSATAPRPVLTIRSSVDYNSSATLYSLVPEFGFDSSHAAMVVGFPYYRAFGTNVSSGGLGDVYVAGFLRGRAAGFDFGSALTAGAPTGDRNKGFGAGKVTIDATGTMARHLEFARPWVSAGFTNSVFNNAGCQRPYITDENALHVSGGVDLTLPRKLAVGIGGFGLEPIGNQMVYSQTMQAGSAGSGGTQQPGQQGTGGMMPGGNMGPGMGNSGGMTMPPATSMPFYDRAQQSMVSASDLRDYGASVWLSIPLHAGLYLSSVVSRILVLQDVTLGAGGVPVEPSFMEQMAGREGSLITASGNVNPTISIQKDGWVRLRLINASCPRFYRLQLEEHALYQIASDGGSLPAPVGLDELLLLPGQRVDLMIQGSRAPGAYRLLNLPYNRGEIAMGMGMGMMDGMGVMSGSSSSASSTIATLVYSGQANRVVPLPQKLVSVEPLPPPARVRSFALGQSTGPGMMGGGMGFGINGRTFDPSRVDTRVRLGDVEDWEFLNPMAMDHPMHIHTNAFQIVQPDGSAEPAWRDVVLVRAGERVRVRMAFQDFTGKLMYHCHILDHEDLGMMGVLEISNEALGRGTSDFARRALSARNRGRPKEEQIQL